MWWSSTAMLLFSSGEKQSIQQFISIKDHQMKAWKDKMTVMAIKHHTKHHGRYYIDLANWPTMLMATKHPIKPLFTSYVDFDATAVDSFPQFNAAIASSAQGQCPAWWYAAHMIQRCCGGYVITNSRCCKPNRKLSSTKTEIPTCRVSMEWMRSTCFNYRKMRYMLSEQMPEMGLSEDKVMNVCRSVRDANLTCTKNLMKKQKTPTAVALQTGSDRPACGCTLRNHSPEPAALLTESDCPAFSSSNQEIKLRTSSITSSSSSSTNRELSYIKWRYSLCRSTHGIHSHWRSIHLHGSCWMCSKWSLEKSHRRRKCINPTQ